MEAEPPPGRNCTPQTCRARLGASCAAEHRFTLLNGYDVLVRTHEAQPWEDAGVHVTLFCEELAQSDNEPEPQRNTRISLDSWPDGCLTGPDARRLAAALLNAADEWDESTHPA